MKSLLIQISRKVAKTGMIESADVSRLVRYSNRHPMWRVTADDQTTRAFDAIMADVKSAAR